ncbi:MAG: tyrosine-type recombinase/integrase [Rhodospirillales bacterium]|nr:tyrosine-type recombinase/integrase [Rhodospirillales bacterium]
MSSKTTPNTLLDADVEGFCTWLRQNRGLAEGTIRNHSRQLSVLLPGLGDDPGHYSATVIRDVLLCNFAKVSRPQAIARAQTMRMYLRFLVSRGDCPASLIGAVPTAANWRLSTLPRYVPLADIERVIASCDTTRPSGIRDRAILLLLARLALRAGDVSNLRMDDIDWPRARLRVCGKSKRTVSLPLPQDAGDALLDYIEQARARVNEDKVFLQLTPPYRPFRSSRRVSGIVSLALQRAGVESPAGRGAHLIRRSVATGLLRSGATVESIGTLLRHRSLETTAIYAKVDVPMLQQVAQPWIGDGSRP